MMLDMWSLLSHHVLHVANISYKSHLARYSLDILSESAVDAEGVNTIRGNGKRTEEILRNNLMKVILEMWRALSLPRCR